MRCGIHIVNPNKKILKENVRKGSTFIVRYGYSFLEGWYFKNLMSLQKIVQFVKKTLLKLK